MPFNTTDTKQPPFAAGCMKLTHDEILPIQTACEQAIQNFVPDDFTPVVNDFYIISRYNESTDYKKAINGDTYNVVKYYNPEYNTQGIDADDEGRGYIVPEPQPEEPEEPTEEPTEETPEEPTEETPEEPTEETPAGEDQPEEAPVEEEPTTEEQPETMAQEITTEEEK